MATLFVLFLSFGLEVLPRWAGLLMLGAMLVQTIAIFIGQEFQAVEEATNPGWNWGLSSVALVGGLTTLIVVHGNHRWQAEYFPVDVFVFVYIFVHIYCS